MKLNSLPRFPETAAWRWC